MKKFDKTKVLVGTATKAYVNGKLLPFASKVSWKMTGDFEDAKVMGEFGTKKIYLGYSSDGTLTQYKNDSSFLVMVAKALKTGVQPDIEIIVDSENKYTKENETVMLKGVVFSEIGYDDETKTIINEQLPFSFEDIDIINTI